MSVEDEFESDLQLFLPIEHTIILTELGLVHNALLKIFYNLGKVSC